MNVIGTAFIRNLATQCRIGCNADERRAWQPVIINVACETDMSAAIASDDRKDCVDYVALHQIVSALAQTTSYRLLEALAAAIAWQALALPHVRSATVEIRKPHKLPGCESVGISLTLLRPEARHDD